MASQPSDPLLMDNMTSQPRQVVFRVGPAEAERLLTYVPADRLARRAQRRALRSLLAALAARPEVLRSDPNHLVSGVVPGSVNREESPSW